MWIVLALIAAVASAGTSLLLKRAVGLGGIVLSTVSFRAVGGVLLVTATMLSGPWPATTPTFWRALAVVIPNEIGGMLRLSAALRLGDVSAVQPRPSFGPPMQLPAEQSGHGWMPAMVDIGSVAVSPVRKRTEESGSTRPVAPVLQSAVPLGGPPTAFSTHTLVGVLPGFGTASGPPKRQPAVVHVRLLPVWADVVPPRVAVWPVQEVMEVTDTPRSGTAYGSGTELPPPPV